MKIRIDNGKNNFKIWLPTGMLTIRLALNFLKSEDIKIDAKTKKLILSKVKELRKIHKPLILVDIETSKKEKVYIEI